MIPASRRDFLRRLSAGLFTGPFVVHNLGLADEKKREVPWLAEVQQPPPRTITLADPGYLEPLLVTEDNQPITTRLAWEKRRQQLRDRWYDFLGEMPEPNEPVKLSVLAEDRPEGCRRQLVRYESEPGLPVEGYLLRPDPLGDEPRSALVVLHQTSSDNIQQVAGVAGPEMQALGLKLARRGFVVFCPRCFLWQDVESLDEAIRKFRKRHPHTLCMRKMLYDAMRAVDVLLTLPEVDPRRIGATGHSLGGKKTLYLAAFDDRIRAAVASEGGTGLPFTDWEDERYLGKGIQAEGFSLNHHQLIAMMAPRAYLILAGESGPPAPSTDDGDRSWQLIEPALPVYGFYSGTPRVGLYNHRQGHTLSPKAFERMAEWLGTYLI
ncbi:MAG: dienelactone hydrolase family protein [Planctomycetaceae bacterium]